MKTKKLVSILLVIIILTTINISCFASNESKLSETDKPEYTGILDPLLPILQCSFNPTWDMNIQDIKNVKNAISTGDSYLISCKINGQSGLMMGTFDEETDLINLVFISCDNNDAVDDIMKTLDESEYLLQKKDGELPKTIYYFMSDGSKWELSLRDDGVLIYIYSPADLDEDQDLDEGETYPPADLNEEQNFKEDEDGYVKEYDEDGNLVHSEEPYYVDGVQTGTLCYDAEIPCYFLDESYHTTSMWILPVFGPEDPVEQCLSFTLNMEYGYMEDPKGLGLQVIYVRENDTFQKVGYLDMPSLYENYTMDFELENPTKIDGFASMAYTPSQAGSFSLDCKLTDVYYIK